MIQQPLAQDATRLRDKFRGALLGTAVGDARGYGAGPPQVFVALARGESWEHAARGLFGGQGSFGNGAAMRVAPAALLAHPDLARIQTVARQTAVITHTHELAQQGASLQACAVGWLLGAQPTTATPGELAAALVAAVRPSAPAAEFQRRLDLLAEGAAWPPEQTATAIGNGIEAIEAVPAALYALLGHPDSFADAVCAAVSLGGDTDTIAAMTGALSGALLGASAIPPAWLERLEALQHPTTLADRLLARNGQA